MKNFKSSLKSDPLGFSSLELSQYLGNKEAEKLLNPKKPKSFKIQLKNETKPSLKSTHDFETIFNIIYRQNLIFSSYESFKELVQNCPYLLRFQWIFGQEDEKEKNYRKLLLEETRLDTCIKWIDPVYEYGLFTEKDLLKHTFIGEYTGRIRKVETKQDELNGYCFQYPAKLFSKKVYVIDAQNEGNELRFLNHSNSPNLQPLWLVHKNLLHLIFIANQNIEKGSELTFDYGKDYWLHRTQN